MRVTKQLSHGLRTHRIFKIRNRKEQQVFILSTRKLINIVTTIVTYLVYAISLIFFNLKQQRLQYVRDAYV